MEWVILNNKPVINVIILILFIKHADTDISNNQTSIIKQNKQHNKHNKHNNQIKQYDSSSSKTN